MHTRLARVSDGLWTGADDSPAASRAAHVPASCCRSVVQRSSLCRSCVSARARSASAQHWAAVACLSAPSRRSASRRLASTAFCSRSSCFPCMSQNWTGVSANTTATADLLEHAQVSRWWLRLSLCTRAAVHALKSNGRPNLSLLDERALSYHTSRRTLVSPKAAKHGMTRQHLWQPKTSPSRSSSAPAVHVRALL